MTIRSLPRSPLAFLWKYVCSRAWHFGVLAVSGRKRRLVRRSRAIWHETYRGRHGGDRSHRS